MTERAGKSNGRVHLRRLAVAVGCLVGLYLLSAVATVLLYPTFYSRYERPDYENYPGLYCYERWDGAPERHIVSFDSCGNALQGYYYPSATPQGLVVIVHGFHAGADDYLPLIEAMLDNGYAVFAYDMTGTYESEGDSTVGMCRALVDLDNALNYIGSTEAYASLPLLLIGHSMGGYAAAAVLELHPEVRACACIAPMNSGADIMVEKAWGTVGPLALAAKPILDVYQRAVFGDYVEYNGVRGINATDIPVLIAQGEGDETITMHGESIYAHLDELTNPNVTVYYGRGAQADHNGIWHSDEAARYMADAADDNVIDHRRYSEVNADLVALILQTFEAGLERR